MSRRTEYERRAARARVWVYALKDKPCVDCGGKFPPECMDFDHVRGEKLFSVMMRLTASKVRLETEIAKCDLVCANCHRIRTKKRYHETHATTHR